MSTELPTIPVEAEQKYMAPKNEVRYFKKRLKLTDFSDSWQNILRREYVYSNDGEYAVRLQKIAGEGGMLVNRTQPRPTVTEVELALRQGCRAEPAVRDVWQRRLQYLYNSKNKRLSAEEWMAKLDDPHWLERFIARHVLVYLGGEMVKPLSAFVRDSSGQVKDTAMWLLQSISTETELRLLSKKDHLLCKECLVRCDRLWIDLPWQRDITFYGCRFCSQSRRFIYCPHHVVAMLDNTSVKTLTQAGDVLRVNWFGHQRPFDFDRVEIIQASDEEVERFAVRIGNDTDPYREPRYRHMTCTIKSECHLSENTVRILGSLFGEVHQGI